VGPDQTSPLTVLYDGHCSLCCRSADALRRMDRGRGRVRLVDFRSDSGPALEAGIQPEALEGAMHAVHADGSVSKGPDAVRDALRAAGWRWVARLLAWPVVGPLFARVYDVIARNRLRWFARRDGDGTGGSCEHGSCGVDRTDQVGRD
jgi:predicted DCC family thiol-disulfide oxidoreductase YuxK